MAIGDTATANGVNGSNDAAQHNVDQNREPKRNRSAQRDATALAEARQRAAIAEQRLDDLRATIAELRQERDAWRAQAQRLALREKPAAKEPGWWHWGRAA
jgi:hypothetical protein